MIGDKLLQEPNTVGDCMEIHKLYGLQYKVNSESLFPNTRSLVKINNHIYEKLHPDTAKELNNYRDNCHKRAMEIMKGNSPEA